MQHCVDPHFHQGLHELSPAMLPSSWRRFAGFMKGHNGAMYKESLSGLSSSAILSGREYCSALILAEEATLLGRD